MRELISGGLAAAMLSFAACSDEPNRDSAPLRLDLPVETPPPTVVQPQPAPVLESVRVEPLGNGVAPSASSRIVLEFDRPAAFTQQESGADGTTVHRLTLGFQRARLRADVERATRVQFGGVARIRAEANRDGSAGVVVELADRVGYDVTILPQPYRVIVDVGPNVRHTVENAAPLARALTLIVLDPGHGGDDHGAPGADGSRESRLVLDIAKRVRERLRTRLPRVRVMLTREDDTFVSLEQRAAMANVADADIFVSIHLNASPTEAERGGVGTFVLDTSGDRQALRLAAAENGSSESEVSELAALLATIQRRDQVAASRTLATRIQYSTLSWGRRIVPNLYDRGVRDAAFYVLVGARMPAVLVEASFVLRAPEAPMLVREDYRETLAIGIAEGIVRYAEGH